MCSEPHATTTTFARTSNGTPGSPVTPSRKRPRTPRALPPVMSIFSTSASETIARAVAHGVREERDVDAHLRAVGAAEVAARRAPAAVVLRRMLFISTPSEAAPSTKSSVARERM